MRRLALLAAGAALAVSGTAGTAQAQNPQICGFGVCVCVAAACYPIPQPGGSCVNIDLDDDGDYETVCLPGATR